MNVEVQKEAVKSQLDDLAAEEAAIATSDADDESLEKAVDNLMDKE